MDPSDTPAQSDASTSTSDVNLDEMPHTRTYSSRALTHKSEIARELFRIIEKKRTNLCISIDVTDPAQVLKICKTLAPKICMVKTHIDILEFEPTASAVMDFVTKLTALAEEHHFLIFEDRKFADIGSTVQNQFGKGIFRIADWAHITNAHSFPGPGIVDGLVGVMKDVEKKLAAEGKNGPLAKRGLLLLAEMSSKGNLSTEGHYKEKTIEMARHDPGHVIGFIAQSRKMFEKSRPRDSREDFIIMTPGVNLGSKGDGLGQQYRTPQTVIKEDGTDVIIVGRGIYGQEDMVSAAEEYRTAGWEAYRERVGGI